jgi:DNA polymerase-3 subunit epsilon
MSRGVSTVERESILVGRALDFLRAGPADAAALVSHVCQLPAVPGVVAEHMAVALLGAYRDFARGEDGKWLLTGAGVPRVAEARPTDFGPSPAPDAAPPVGDRAPGTGRGLEAPPHEEAGVGDALDALAYAVVDVETTGGRPGYGDRITEVAAVVVEGGRIVDTFATLVNPQRSIPPMITAITNITWEMVRDQPTFGEVCGALLERLEGRVFVAHNASFDWAFVAAEVERATGRRLDGSRLCTVRLARRVLPQLPRRNLDWVSRHYGIEIGSRHRAEGDAVATAHVLLRLLADARRDHGVERWCHLERLLSARTGAAKRSRRRPAMPHPVTRDTTA